METQEYTDLVGILVGTIMVNARPLVFYLYNDPMHRRHARVVEYERSTHTPYALRELTKAFEPVLIDIWCNKFHPCWYFLQVNQQWGPDRLGCFGLPWTVYHDWQKQLLAE